MHTSIWMCTDFCVSMFILIFFKVFTYAPGRRDAQPVKQVRITVVAPMPLLRARTPPSLASAVATVFDAVLETSATPSIHQEPLTLPVPWLL